MFVGKKITILSFEHISTIFTDQNLDLASHTLRREEGSGHAAADGVVAEECNYQTVPLG